MAARRWGGTANQLEGQGWRSVRLRVAGIALIGQFSGPRLFHLSAARRSPPVLCRRPPPRMRAVWAGRRSLQAPLPKREAPPVQPSPGRCAPAPLPSSGPSAPSYARPQETAPEGADAGTAPAEPPGQRKRIEIMTRKSTPTNAKPATRSRTDRQPVTLEMVARLAPHQGLADNL